MTREDFISGINDFDSLDMFCIEHECEELMDGLYSSDIADYILDEYIRELPRDMSWITLRDILSNIDDDSDWYVNDECYILKGADSDDFERFKECILIGLEGAKFFESAEPEAAESPQEDLTASMDIQELLSKIQ